MKKMSNSAKNALLAISGIILLAGGVVGYFWLTHYMGLSWSIEHESPVLFGTLAICCSGAGLLTAGSLGDQFNP